MTSIGLYKRAVVRSAASRCRVGAEHSAAGGQTVAMSLSHKKNGLDSAVFILSL